MALKAVHVSDIHTLDQVPEAPSLSVSSSFLPRAVELGRGAAKAGKFLVIGHRGKGMNALASPDRRLREFKENSVLSFNQAALFPVDYVEFDVQVTRDGCPIIFHDDYILAVEEDGNISEKRVTDLSLEEFLAYGPQKESGKVGKQLLRKLKNGGVSVKWNVEIDAPLCTLQQVFQQVDPHLGFNVELKFDDHIDYKEEELISRLQAVLKVVYQFADDQRPIFFSSFHPDAARLMQKLQIIYPVFFLTDGGVEIYTDRRRNSLEEAVELCLTNGLHGIVSQVKAIFKYPAALPRIKEANLTLLTYGALNNVPEAVYLQHLMGINGVIVDLVPEITKAVSGFVGGGDADGDDSLSGSVGGKEENEEQAARPNFTQRELSFLLRLIPELVQH